MREQTDLRLGIEADFVPGREDRMASLLEARDWDYVIGSIHFVGDVRARPRGLRHLGLGPVARQGLVDVLRMARRARAQRPATTSSPTPTSSSTGAAARPFPDGDLRRFYELAMDGIAESGIAIEVSTAGLRKPVGEIYPDRAFLEMCVDAGNPVALSSDAHVAEQLGYGYDDALELLAGRRRGRARAVLRAPRAAGWSRSEWRRLR